MSQKKPLPPGPRRFPIVGNLVQLKGDGMFYEKLNGLRQTHGEVIYLRLGGMDMVVLFGHDNVKAALTSDADKFKYRPDWLQEISSMGLYHGLVWSNGLNNERLRAFVRPVFHGDDMQVTLMDRVKTEADMTLKEVSKCQGNSADLKQLFYLAICNINCGMIFGQRYEYNDDTFLELTTIMDQLLQKHGVSNMKNFFTFLRRFPDSSKDKHLKATLQKLKEFIQKRVDDARTNQDISKHCLVHMFLSRESSSASSDDVITVENLSHITRDLFVAGSENVACGLLWCVAYMIKYPEVQQKCRQAVIEGQSNVQDSPLTSDNTPVYVQATVREILRMANIAPLSVPHATQAEVTFGKFSVPAQCMVLTHLQSVHFDPAYWDSPTDFRPERFIGDQQQILDKEAFYPFSIGPRYCIAEKLAILELNVFVCELLRHYSFESVGEGPSMRPTQPGAFVEPEHFQVKVTAIK